MKHKLPLALSLLLAGCASFQSQVFWVEKAAVDSTYAALQTWKGYMHQTTNTLAQAGKTNEWAQLVSDDAKVNQASRTVGAAFRVLDTYVSVYQTNSNFKAQVQAALAQAQAQSSNFVWLTGYLKGLMP